MMPVSTSKLQGKRICLGSKLYVKIIAVAVAQRRDEHKDHLLYALTRELMVYKQIVFDLGATHVLVHPADSFRGHGVMFVRMLNEADNVRHRLGPGRCSPFQLSMAIAPPA